MGIFSLESQMFEDGEVIPKKFGYKNGNSSPPLKFNNVPKNTLSLALIMDDPDAVAAVGKVWVHWVLWNIDSKINGLKENSIPSGCIEGETDFGEIGYGGPAPPDKEHTYIFRLYALDVKLDSARGSTKNQVEEDMKNHIIAETCLKGRYSP